MTAFVNCNHTVRRKTLTQKSPPGEPPFHCCLPFIVVLESAKVSQLVPHLVLSPWQLLVRRPSPPLFTLFLTLLSGSSSSPPWHVFRVKKRSTDGARRDFCICSDRVCGDVAGKEASTSAGSRKSEPAPFFLRSSHRGIKSGPFVAPAIRNRNPRAERGEAPQRIAMGEPKASRMKLAESRKCSGQREECGRKTSPDRKPSRDSSLLVIQQLINRVSARRKVPLFPV